MSKSTALFKALPGPAHLRYNAQHRLVTWQPRGVLDAKMVDEIATWLLVIEKVSLPFKRFVDFGKLTKVTLRIDHVFKVARKRVDDFPGVAPIRTAFFCEQPIGYSIACLYESLMEKTLIKARAFRDLTSAAEWLAVPESILTLADKPAAQI